MELAKRYLWTAAMAVFTVTPITQAQTANLYPACDITDVETVFSASMEQLVTLTTKLKSDGKGLPRGHLSLALANGTKIDLGSGGKYHEEAPSEFSGCEEHLQAAKSSTIDSLTVKADNNPYNYIASLQGFSALLTMGQDCQFPAGEPNRDRHELSYDCQRAADFLSNYNDKAADISKSWPEGRYQELLELNAPIIYVAGSTYYTTLNVYDPIDNIMRELMYEGC